MRNNQRQLRELQEVKSSAKSLATADVSPYSREYEARMTALRSRGSMSARRAIHGTNGTPTRLQPLQPPAKDGNSNGNGTNDTNHTRYGSNGSNGSHHSNDEKVPTVQASQSMRKLRESSSASYMAANGGNNNVAIGVGMVMDSVHNAKAPTHGYAVNHPLASLVCCVVLGRCSLVLFVGRLIVARSSMWA